MRCGCTSDRLAAFPAALAAREADEDGARTDDLSLTDLLELAWLQRARGSNKTVMVELRGFEPLTPSYRPSRPEACHWSSDSCTELPERRQIWSLFVTDGHHLEGVFGG